MADLIFFESFLLLLLGLLFCELDGRKWWRLQIVVNDDLSPMVNFKLTAQGVHVHTYFTDEDFTDEEIARNNALAVAVLYDRRLICKFCGDEVDR